MAAAQIEFTLSPELEKAFASLNKTLRKHVAEAKTLRELLAALEKRVRDLEEKDATPQ